MKKLFAWAFLLWATLSPAAAEPISGQVFIVTRGHQSIKLGLVVIAAFDRNKVLEAIAQVRQSTDGDRDKLNQLLPKLDHLGVIASRGQAKVRASKTFTVQEQQQYDFLLKLGFKVDTIRSAALAYQDYLSSGQLLFDHLPAPIVTTKTDADGNFAMDVVGEHALALGAAATRNLPSGETESYFWLVPFDGGPNARVILSNDNLTSEKTDQSLVNTGNRVGKKASIGELYSRLDDLNSRVAAYQGRSAQPKTRAKP
jgi:hypothetical protein